MKNPKSNNSKSKENQMQEAFLYTRVSTDEPTRQYSLSRQRERLEAYCRNNGIVAVKHFEDDCSAKTFDRPAFNKLLDSIKKNKGQAQKLLVLKWDRFTRNLVAGLSMISQLRKLGVEVEAIEQPIDDDIPENILMQAIYLAIPQAENMRRASNTKLGMRAAMKRGRYLGKANKTQKIKKKEEK